MEANPLSVTNSIQDAAEQVLSHSFAVYRVEEATAIKIRAAHRAAVGFFNGTTGKGPDAVLSDIKHIRSKPANLIEDYQCVKDGNLYGYNLPLPSKELFRTWYDCNAQEKGDEEQQLKYFIGQQLWPSDDFCEASFHLAKDLHRLLSECLGQIQSLQRNNRFCAVGVGEEEAGESIVSSYLGSVDDHKRQRTPIDSPPPKRLRSKLGAIPVYDGNGRGEEKNRSTRPFFHPSKCPLDYFFYHNRLPNLINCSEHVDRGALVVVCLTSVPGLEVLSPSTSSFYCPEALVHNENLYRERTENDCCPNLVCIMAGDQLSRLLPASNPPSACVHRVRNPLRREERMQQKMMGIAHHGEKYNDNLSHEKYTTNQRKISPKSPTSGMISDVARLHTSNQSLLDEDSDSERNNNGLKQVTETASGAKSCTNEYLEHFEERMQQKMMGIAHYGEKNNDATNSSTDNDKNQKTSSTYSCDHGTLNHDPTNCLNRSLILESTTTTLPASPPNITTLEKLHQTPMAIAGQRNNCPPTPMLPGAYRLGGGGLNEPDIEDSRRESDDATVIPVNEYYA